ncbi:serine/threonine protein kinase [Cohnella sp.]|uniref:serine/threonine protein kinase n=1 Tax=Cohnella sp. TaxID=1883426 RepID=UPI00257FA3C3|nr:serine/threonine protein kinase [Cohnella sp.]
MTTSSESRLPPGTVLRGKWNGKSYTLRRLLGVGSNGQVYLAASGRSICAVKIGQDPAELQAEANVLASLDKRERGRSPFLLDVDDAVAGERVLPFYAMQYVPGMPVKTYIRRYGEEWVGVIGYRLLKRLSELHAAGWVFGDLKSDNILVGQYGRVSLVDYGGTTAMGRGVRQFTELYDRGFWSAGSRTAEPSYDWFAVAMLWIHVLDGKRLVQLSRTLLPQNRHPRELMTLVRTNRLLKPLESWLERALAGGFRDTEEACEAWRLLQQPQQRQAGNKSGVPGWMAGLFAVSLLLFVSVTAYWLLR